MPGLRTCLLAAPYFSVARYASGKPLPYVPYVSLEMKPRRKEEEDAWSRVIGA
jgi:hypothetical protein